MDAVEFFRKVRAREVLAVVDDPQVGAHLAGAGFTVRDYDDHDFTQPASAPALVIISKLPYHDRFNQLWDQTQGVISQVALAKFDTSFACLRYSLDQMLSANHEDTLRRRAEYYAQLLSQEQVEVLTPGARLVCRFEESVEVANDDLVLNEGWLYSASEFFETSIVNLAADRSSFTVDGEQRFDGMLFLANEDAVKRDFGAFIEEMRQRTAAGGGLAVWEANRLVRLTLDGWDATAPFLEMCAGRERESSAVEFAVGCVEFPGGLDWRFNSVINEGVHGVHLGVGMGFQIPHLDFVSVGATLR